MDSPEPVRIGIIDLGSNTARLVIMAAIPGFSYRMVDEIREVVRLRQGMSRKGLDSEAVERGMSTLRLFKRFCDTTGVEVVLATATSAVREAANGGEFVDRVESEIGLSIRVLSGEEEACYGVIGSLNEVPIEQGLVLDIGGGSAQISEVKDGRFSRGKALTLGALALTERFVSTDPIANREYSAVQEEIERQLDSVGWLKRRDGNELVGLGGSIRNLASMEAKRQGYPLNTCTASP